MLEMIIVAVQEIFVVGRRPSFKMQFTEPVGSDEKSSFVENAVQIRGFAFDWTGGERPLFSFR